MIEPTCTIRVEVDERGVARLTLARPGRHNALSGEMIGELTEAAASLGADPAVRVVVLAGEGESFCAGGDLNWMRAQMDATRDQRLAAARSLAHMLKALNELPKPLVARVHGAAYGGGVGLLTVCDVAIAADTARFGLTETRLGLIPATIGPYVVARIGEGRARRIILSGRRFDADEARALEIVTTVVPAEALDAALEEAVTEHLRAGPDAVAAAKRLVRGLGAVIDDGVIERSVEALADVWEGDEARRMVEGWLG